MIISENCFTITSKAVIMLQKQCLISTQICLLLSGAIFIMETALSGCWQTSNKVRRLISVNINLGFYIQVFHHLQQLIMEILQGKKVEFNEQQNFLGQHTSCIAIRRISVQSRIFKYKYRLIKGSNTEHRNTESQNGLGCKAPLKITWSQSLLWGGTYFKLEKPLMH